MTPCVEEQPIARSWFDQPSSDESEVNDEVTVTIPRRRAHQVYAKHFERLWRHNTRRL